MNKSQSKNNKNFPIYVCPRCNTHGNYIGEYQEYVPFATLNTLCFTAKCVKCFNVFILKIDVYEKPIDKYEIYAPEDKSDRTKQLSNIVRIAKIMCESSRTLEHAPKIGTFVMYSNLKSRMVMPIHKFVLNGIQKIIENTIPKLISINYILHRKNCPFDIINIIFQLMLGKELFDIIPFESINAVFQSFIVSVNLEKQLAL